MRLTAPLFVSGLQRRLFQRGESQNNASDRPALRFRATTMPLPESPKIMHLTIPLFLSGLQQRLFQRGEAQNDASDRPALGFKFTTMPLQTRRVPK